MTEIYEQKPADFHAQIEVAACYIEIDGKLLLLQRPDGKSEAGAWGVPGGKLEIEETPEQAAVRELFEETGIQIKTSSEIRPFGHLYFRKDNIDFIFHLFKITLHKMPPIDLSDEHQYYTWATPQEMNAMNLMKGTLKAYSTYKQREKNHAFL